MACAAFDHDSDRMPPATSVASVISANNGSSDAAGTPESQAPTPLAIRSSAAISRSNGTERNAADINRTNRLSKRRPR